VVLNRRDRARRSGVAVDHRLNARDKLDDHPTFAATAQLTVTRSGRRLTPQGYVSAIHIVNPGFRHQVQSGLTAIMTVPDGFNGRRFRRVATAPTAVGRLDTASRSGARTPGRDAHRSLASRSPRER
jgi:hypothetical protein